MISLLTVSCRIYRFLLLAYPLTFRQRFGADMLQVFRDCGLEALHEQGRKGMLRLWIRTLPDLVRSIAIQQIRTFQRKDDFLMSTELFDQQMVSTFDLMSRMLREGYSLMQALQQIAARAPEPTASHVSRMLEDVKNGTPWLEALNAMQERLQSARLPAVVDVMTQQIQEGGNLADRLDTTLTRLRSPYDAGGWSDQVSLNQD